MPRIRPAAPAAAALLLCLVPLASARALPGAIGACGGNAFALCFNLTDFAFGAAGAPQGLGAHQLRFTLANATAAAYAPATLRTFLISGLGGAYRVSSVVASSGGTYTGASSVGQPNADNGYSGVGYAGPGYEGAQQPNFVGWDNPGSAGLAAGQAATFTFTFTRNVVQSDFVAGDAFAPGVRFLAQAHGADASVGARCGATSSKAAFDAGGAPLAAGPSDPACALEGEGARLGAGKAAVVPEPGTLVLLGTGVVGVVLAARRRRA